MILARAKDASVTRMSFYPRFARVLPFALILLCGLVAYGNTFHVPFVFDDHTSILLNESIHDLRTFLAEGWKVNPRRFVGYLTLSANYHFGGPNVVGYHAVNLGIHLLSALLVYALARTTFQTPFLKKEVEGSSFILHPSSFVPLLAALLFVVHPVQTQAVTYIVQRLASLATMFYLLSLVLFIQARLRLDFHVSSPASRVPKVDGPGTSDSGHGKRKLVPILLLAASAFSAVLAMRTKEIAFTLPFAILLYEFSFFPGGRKRNLLFLLPILATVVIVPLGLMGSDRSLGEMLSDVSEQTRVQTDMPRLHYLFTQFRVIVTYLRLLVLPLNQNLDYDYPVFTTFLTPPVFLSFLLLASLLALAVYLYRRSRLTNPQPLPPQTRLLGFGILWFFLTLSVESSLIPIEDVIYEHRLYLPSVGAFIALSTAAGFLSQGRSARFLWIASFTALVLLTGATWQRNRVWGDAVSLWHDVVRKSPNKARPHDNLGFALLYDKDEVDRAIGEFQTALKLDPYFFSSRHALGVAFMRKGRTEEAAEQFRLASSLRPNSAEAQCNLANALIQSGRFRDAVDAYTVCLDLEPADASARYNLGIAYYETRNADAAVVQFSQTLALNPDHFGARYNLGVIFAEKGMPGRAAEQFEHVIRQRPDLAGARFNLGQAYLKLGRRDAAIEQMEEAIRLNPQNSEYRSVLAEEKSRTRE